MCYSELAARVVALPRQGRWAGSLALRAGRRSETAVVRAQAEFRAIGLRSMRQKLGQMVTAECHRTMLSVVGDMLLGRARFKRLCKRRRQIIDMNI